MPTAVSLPAHLKRVGELLFANGLTAGTESPPERFTHAQLTPDGPPWHTIITGLETDRFEMRERLEASLEQSTPKNRSWLGHAILACYSGLFGFRSNGIERAGFLAWVESLPDDMVAKPAVLRGAGRLRPFDAGGLAALALDRKSGHVPVGHDLLLYHIAELVPALGDALFSETPSFAQDRPAHGAEDAYKLSAWFQGKSFESTARFYGDVYDVDSVLGFLNSISEAAAFRERFFAPNDGQIVTLAR